MPNEFMKVRITRRIVAVVVIAIGAVLANVDLRFVLAPNDPACAMCERTIA